MMTQQNEKLPERWDAISLPGAEHTENAFSKCLQVLGKNRQVLNCAIPLTRAKTLTDFQLPDGLDIQACMTASVTGNFPEALREWRYQPKIRCDTVE
ncbi:MAG: hypothetical protein ABSH38_15325 [Verrucomicrobiota bacterium]|jgi:hypothetical protein